MNDKQIINQIIKPFSPLRETDGWRHLQHASTLMGLSRRPLSKDDILRLIDTRKIRWAWDIARQDSRRPEIRIWRQSVLDYLGHENGGEVAPDDGLSLAQVIAAVLPHPAAITLRTATIRANDLHRRFLCCGVHLRGLINDGELSCAGRAATLKTLTVSYLSAFEFLKRRSLSV